MVKNNTIEDLIPDLGFDLNTPFIIDFTENIKVEQLVSHKVREKIAFILLEEVFDSLDCKKENTI